MKAQLVELLNLLFCATGIWLCFFYWGVLQERISTKPYTVNGEKKVFTGMFVLNIVQAAAACVVALVGIIYAAVSASSSKKKGDEEKSVGLRAIVTRFGIIGITIFIGPQFGYASIRRLSYPMVLTVKMCKMIPILAVGMLWHRVRYPMKKILNVVLITSGVVGMVLLAEEKHKASRDSSLLGVILCAINLMFDGYTNSTQDVVHKQWNWHGPKIMFGSNIAVVVWSTLYLGVVEVLHAAGKMPVELIEFAPPELSKSIAFFIASPDALHDVVLMGFVGACGQFFIFRAISSFGSLTTTALTLTRKVGSVFVSIYFNDHVLAYGQWVSLFFVVIGVILDTWFNITSKKPAPSSPTSDVEKKKK